jgi:hypothetical protein
MNRLSSMPGYQRDSFATLVGDVAAGAKELAAAHGEQLRAEVRAETTKATSVAVLVGAAAVLSVVGFVFLLVALVQWLNQGFALSLAASWAIVGGIVFFIGLIVALIAREQAASLRMVPRKTLNSIRESLQWITQR